MKVNKSFTLLFIILPNVGCHLVTWQPLRGRSSLVYHHQCGVQLLIVLPLRLHLLLLKNNLSCLRVVMVR